MKTKLRLAALATLALLSTGTAFAAGEHDGHHAPPATAAAAAPEFAEGTVKKVDKAAGRVTISHGPLTTLDMPPMTMVFRAGTAGMLDDLKAGDRIRFIAERAGGVFTVTTLERMP